MNPHVVPGILAVFLLTPIQALSNQPACSAEYEAMMDTTKDKDAAYQEKIRGMLDGQRKLTRLVGTNCEESTSVLKDYRNELDAAEKEFEKAVKDYEPWKNARVPLIEKSHESPGGSG